MNHRARVVLTLATAFGLVILCCIGGITVYFVGGLQGTPARPDNGEDACGELTTVTPTANLPDISSLSAEQVRNAAIIIQVGQERNVPPRGWVIAIATALQESGLRNLPDLGSRNDHDSLGLFQQRPSAGWGTPIQILDPTYAAGKFYAKLMTVQGWQTMSLTAAAQRVQRSAYPNAYAKHEPLATTVVNILAGGAARAAGALARLRCARGSEIAASGWTPPVTATISATFGPSHNGVDLAAARGTSIRAAAAGMVIAVACEARLKSGAWYGCDRDGSSQVIGCGWWVEIQHAGDVITRYCHLGKLPEVVVGQQVTAGQRIGEVGATGNIDGPRCTFEVHINGDRNASGAVDPVAFMRQQGAALGDPS
jgi:murein DD-endopeptidase MepM/ murein hydrolase activator NlpD